MTSAPTHPRKPSRWPLVMGIGAGVLMFAASVAMDRDTDARRKREYVQAGYDYGVKVGRVVGMCESLQAVADKNPDSAWAHSPEVTDALTSCAVVRRKTAPGTALSVQEAASEAGL